MTRPFKLLALVGFTMLAPVLLSAQEFEQAPSHVVMKAAEAAFPQDLRYAGKPPSEDTYHTCAAVFSRSANGAPDLIAAGYSGDGAKVAILANTPDTANIISDISHQQFLPTDGACNLQIANLADPEHPESRLAKTIEVTFSDGPDWFFTWDGKKLQNITALKAELGIWRGRKAPESDMYSANVVDIDHRGPMQIVGNNGDWDKFPDNDGIVATPTFTLFRYNGSSYVRDKTLLTIKEFEPNIPKTTEDLVGFDNRSLAQINVHQDPAPSNRLKIVNGDRDGSNRVKNAKIEVNGVTIVLAGDINQSMETLTRTIQLQKENDIRVTVDGPAESHLYLTVE